MGGSANSTGNAPNNANRNRDESPALAQQPGQRPHQVDSAGPTRQRQIELWEQQYGNDIKRFLMSLVRNTELSEDLFQEVFLRATRAYASYREQGTGKAWLLQIAHRLTLEHFRNSHRENLMSNQWWESRQPQTQQALLLDSETLEESDRILNAILQLGECQRRVIWLRYYVQLDFQTIANIIGSPVGTVSSNCYRGLSHLRDILKDQYRS